MNLIERWIASVFLKRFALSLATAGAAYLAGHSLPAVSHLAAFGINLTISIDPERFADAVSVSAFALGQGLHEYVAAKYPLVGKFL